MIDISDEYINNSKRWNECKKVFENTYPKVKDQHRYASGKFYTQTSKESAADMINIIETVARLDGMTLEMVGRFIWANGRARQHDKILRTLGFTYQENKAKYCKSYEGYERHDGRKFSYSKIKAMYQYNEETA